MANECPVYLELKTSIQLGKLLGREYPQPFHFISNECYMTLKSKIKLIFDKFSCPTCRRDVHVLNLGKIDEGNTCTGNQK